MALAADDLRSLALALPHDERASLASDLLASLDEEDVDLAEVEHLWSEETERRMAMLESGEAELVTWDHVQDRIEQQRSLRRGG